jgi:catechol 2,3-dioxygenase-like lactoylglutathione lyase family enzyme
MIKRISVIAVVVEDQEDALQWYTERLGLEKRADQRLSEDIRWVSVAPPSQKDLEITLADWKWYGDRTQDPRGKNPVVVLESSSCREDYENLKAKGVRFADPPKDQPWGVSAVFLDLYGNPYNLVERKTGR